MKYWLFNTDPYNGWLYSPHKWWVVYSHIYPKQPVFFHCSNAWSCLDLLEGLPRGGWFFWDFHDLDLRVFSMLGKSDPTILSYTIPKTNIDMENPPFWWYLQGNMGIFMGYVSFREGKWWFFMVIPYHPWEWYIYLHFPFTYIWLIFMGNVGKYTVHGCYGDESHGRIRN